MSAGKDSQAFGAMWRRIMSDPLLPRLRTAYARNDVPEWTVRDGHIVIEPDGPAAGRSTAPAELPIPPNELIGRRRECDEVVRAVHRSPLVTLTGLAGVGKTRVALQVASDLDKAFAGGAVWVDLAGTADSELVLHEVSTRLGVQQGGAVFAPGEQTEERPFVERLAEKLHRRSLLLVLDNCEHVLDGCRELVRALRGPKFRVLCTSREALGVDDEHVLRLDPLPVPSNDRLSVQEAVGWDAVVLFLQRANPDGAWPLRDADVPLVVQICQRLEGVPYAIELAAAKVGVVPLEEILERLARLRPGDEPPTQATIAWSYHLLSPDQQLLLRRLAVFRGGFGLDAACEVCAVDGLTTTQVRDLLGALLESSLVFREPFHTPARLNLLETTREYALAKLDVAGEAARVRARHRAWICRLVESLEPRLSGATQVEALDALDAELDNIRAALESTDLQGAAQRLRIACALQRFWVVRGLLSEGRTHVERALECMDDDGPERATGAGVASKLAGFAGDLDEANHYGHEALRRSRRLGDRPGEAAALQQLGIEAHQRGRLAEAEALCQQSLTIARETGNSQGMVLVLNRLGGIAESLGDSGGARAFFDEATQVARDAGDVLGIAWSLYWRGRLSADQGRFGEAKESLEEALSLSQRLGYRQQTVHILIGIGHAAYLRGDEAIAEAYLLEALDVAQNLEDQTSLALCISGLADLEVAKGRLESAHRWLASSDAGDPLLGPNARAALLRSHARCAQEAGDLSGAARLHGRALSLWYRLRELRHVPGHLEDLAHIASDQRAARRATVLLALAGDLRRALDTPLPAADQVKVADARTRLLSLLGPSEFASAWDAGTARSVDEAVTYALS